MPAIGWFVAIAWGVLNFLAYILAALARLDGSSQSPGESSTSSPIAADTHDDQREKDIAMLKRIAEADEEGFTDEECPAWNHPELDQYVVCLRCEHYQDDCPHECGPEFGFDDVAACLEERAATIVRLTTERDNLRAIRLRGRLRGAY